MFYKCQEEPLGMGCMAVEREHCSKSKPDDLVDRKIGSWVESSVMGLMASLGIPT